MDTAYWILEYLKVFLAYAAVLFVWPSVVFGGYLKGKSRAVRFAFCTLVPVVLFNTVVLGLGLLHLLYGWLFALLFYGTFCWALWRRLRGLFSDRTALRRLLLGTCGVRLFLSKAHTRVRAWRKAKQAQLSQELRGHRLEYLTLFIVIVFGMVYFSYGAFQNVCFGTSDLSVHHSWTYELLEGNIFCSGIYPEGMHCFLYALRVLFHVSIYSQILFLPGIYAGVLLLSVYLFLRALCAWRGTPVLALALLLTLDVTNVNSVVGFARLQWCLPQEFSFYAMFLCPLFLLRCLKSDYSAVPKGIWKKIKLLYTNENLLLFQMALAVTIVSHFYTTIMAFFLCAAIAICRCVSFFSKKRLLCIAAVVFCGLFVSVAPMAVAFAEGYPFQGSIGWALGVISGEEDTETGTETGTEAGTEIGSEVLQTTEAATETLPGDALAGAAVSTETGATGVQETTAWQKITNTAQQLLYKFREKAYILYESGFVRLFSAARAPYFIGAGAIGTVLWLFYRLCSKIFAQVRHSTEPGGSRMDGIPVLVLSALLVTAECASTELGIPHLMELSRLGFLAQVLACTALFLPLDVLLGLLAATPLRTRLLFLVPFGVCGIYCGTRALGMFHGYLFFNLTRYNAAVDTTNRILESYDRYTYTIVSPTDELYQVIEDGRHEEALTFVRSIDSELYTLPTEYLFIYVEKQPIAYVQYHFFTGPDWLAEESYRSFYGDLASEGDTIYAGTVSDDAAEETLVAYARASEYYKDETDRTIIESKLYQWCQEFCVLYPEDVTVYYEDESFCCYRIRQNTYRLYRLENP